MSPPIFGSFISIFKTVTTVVVITIHATKVE